MDGWVRLHRALIEWEWYKDSNMVHLFTHMLLRANHKTKKWKGIEINAGQFISGRKVLSAETGISERSIRTCISKLKSTSELTTKISNRFTIFTINNWKYYQPEIIDGKPVTSKRPASDQQATTNKNVKNVKNKEYLPDSYEIRLSKYLFDFILERNSNHKKPNFQKWAVYINKLIRINKKNHNEIGEVIKWCQEDDFWQNNILSTLKLHKQYDQLVLKMKHQSPEQKKSAHDKKYRETQNIELKKSIKPLEGDEAPTPEDLEDYQKRANGLFNN